jgi:alkane 1-monooxygenase
MWIHYAKYFITPALAPFFFVGILLGGPWMWLGFTILATVVLGGDLFLGEDTSEPDYRHTWILEIPLFAALPLLGALLLTYAWSLGSGTQDFLYIGAALSAIFDYDFFAARAGNQWYHYLGGAISAGFLVAGYGTNVAHELCHRTRAPWSVRMSRWILSMSANADFSIEHVYGHHANVCTDKDPATARRGENVYGFFFRSTIMGHVSAWEIELKRLKRKKLPVWSWHNKMFTGYAMTLAWAVLFYAAAGWFGVGFFLVQALMAKFILEVVNYMEHYGMSRDAGTKIAPHHSWNTNKKMSGVILYSLTRHSAHHEKGSLPFWKLSAYPDAPEMPQGYLTTLFLCLVPPVWKRVIDPRLAEWDRLYGEADADVSGKAA